MREKPLQRNSYYYWKVKANTNKGETAWSEPALWQVGLLQFQDWVGQWIGFDRRFPWDGDPQGSRLSARYFRKEFDCDKEIRSATAYIIGLGFYELRINGRKIGDRVLAPVQTEFTKNVKYNAFDVTDALKRGRNAIGIVLGNGMYFTMQQFQQAFKIKNFGYPKVLFNLAITYADGSSRVIFTNDSWKGTADGPIRANNLYDGEEYDATRSFRAGTRRDSTTWRMAAGRVRPGAGRNLRGADDRPDEGRKRTRPRLRNGENGRPVHRRFRAKPDGMDAFQRPRRARTDCPAEIRRIARRKRRAIHGQPPERQSRRVVHPAGRRTRNLRTGFYVLRFPIRRSLRLSRTMRPSDFTACMVSDDMRTVGSFKTSDELLNRIYRNAWWGIAGN